MRFSFYLDNATMVFRNRVRTVIDLMHIFFMPISRYNSEITRCSFTGRMVLACARDCLESDALTSKSLLTHFRGSQHNAWTIWISIPINVSRTFLINRRIDIVSVKDKAGRKHDIENWREAKESWSTRWRAIELYMDGASRSKREDAAMCIKALVKMRWIIENYVKDTSLHTKFQCLIWREHDCLVYISREYNP